MKVREAQDWDRLREMSGRIEDIERLVLDLKKLGQGIPVIEKNTRAILSFIHVLRFGISDVAELTEKTGGTNG